MERKRKKHLKLFLKVHCSDKHLEEPLCWLESEHSCHANENTQTFQYLRNAGHLVWLLKTLFLIFKQTRVYRGPQRLGQALPPLSTQPFLTT